MTGIGNVPRGPRAPRGKASGEGSSAGARRGLGRGRPSRKTQEGMSLEWSGRVWRPGAAGAVVPPRSEELERFGCSAGAERGDAGRLVFGDAAEVGGMLLGE